MPLYTKVPSQAASGADTFSDNLVGFQITDGSSLMTMTNFAIDNTIPERDSKTFHTQPFSDFITLDNLNQETAAVTTILTGSTVDPTLKFYGTKDDASKSLFGSLTSRLSVSVTNIISKFPAALFVDGTNPIGVNNLTAESITYDPYSNTTQFKIQSSIIYNPFDISLVAPNSLDIPDTDNNIRNLYSSYTLYIIPFYFHYDSK